MYHWFTKTYPSDVFKHVAKHASGLFPSSTDGSDDVTPWLTAEDSSGCAALTVAMTALRLVRHEHV